MRFSSIDDFLGPADRRFFGLGLKGVRHAIAPLSVGAPDGARRGVAGLAELSHPGEWSRQTSGMPFAPHIDCLDALALTVQLCEAYLLHTYGLDPAQRGRMWLRRYEFRASAEERLTPGGFPVRASLIETVPAPRSLGGYVSTFECRLATVRTWCTVEHELTAIRSAPAVFGSAHEALGPGAERFHDEGYRRRSQRITEVTVRLPENRVEAAVSVEPDEDAGLRPADLGGAYHPSLSAIDCLAVQAQLGQVLLYQMDGAAKIDGGTLRIRRVVLSAQTPYQPLAGPFRAFAETHRSRLLTWGGGTWRTTRLVGHCQGIQASLSLAHELPAAMLLTEARPRTVNTAFH
ncbi:AvrD family protein [Kitasatospora sp. NPDC049258]|uniref:AvrD family protein n=1 Tax=Kitasatospora sp. NPDC049258 TaxID=3155394 RepID=UPI00342F9160